DLLVESGPPVRSRPTSGRATSRKGCRTRGPTTADRRSALHMADFMLRVANFNILVVEDDDNVRRLLAEHLTARMPVNVDSARDGVEALHQISTTPYAVVILDLMMPKMSGTDLLDALVALSSDPSVKAMETPPPIVVITGAPESALPDDDH